MQWPYLAVNDVGRESSAGCHQPTQRLCCQRELRRSRVAAERLPQKVGELAELCNLGTMTDLQVEPLTHSSSGATSLFSEIDQIPEHISKCGDGGNSLQH